MRRLLWHVQAAQGCFTRLLLPPDVVQIHVLCGPCVAGCARCRGRPSPKLRSHFANVFCGADLREKVQMVLGREAKRSPGLCLLDLLQMTPLSSSQSRQRGETHLVLPFRFLVALGDAVVHLVQILE